MLIVDSGLERPVGTSGVMKGEWSCGVSGSESDPSVDEEREAMPSLVGAGDGDWLRAEWHVDSRLRFRYEHVGLNRGPLESSLEVSRASSVVMKQAMGAAVDVADVPSSAPPPCRLSATLGTGRMVGSTICNVGAMLVAKSRMS